LAFEPLHLSANQLTKQCTGVADRVEFVVNVVGGNPVIVVVSPHSQTSIGQIELPWDSRMSA
jgi:hypothetical protein